MKLNHRSPWFPRFFCFRHGLTWILIFLLLLRPPRVAGQTLSPPRGYLLDPKSRVTPATAIILACLLCAFFVMGCVSIYVRQCIELRASQTFVINEGGVLPAQRLANRGLDPSVIDAFPTLVYSEVKELKIGKGSLECAVCLTEFEDDDHLRLLNKCSHVFHPDCIDAWLSSHTTCPVCRANLALDPGEPFSFTFPNHNMDSRSPNDRDPENLNSNPNLPVDDSVVPTQLPERKGGTFRKSFSTGHDSLVGPGESSDRFKLRLPEDVRNRLVSASLNRTKSCTVAFPRVRSGRKGYRSGSGGTGRRRNFEYYYEAVERANKNAVVYFRSWSEKVISGEEGRGNPKRLLRSVTTPLQRLFGGKEGNNEKDEAGERSTDRLRLESDSNA